MHTRAVNFTGATDIDAGVSFLQDKVLPAMRDQQGYRGLIASADRAGGVFGVLSLWDTAEDREASDSMLAPTRQEAAEVIGGEMKVEKYEQLVAEVGQEPPGPGSALMVMRISMDPARSTTTRRSSRAMWLPGSQRPTGFGGSAT